MLNLNFPQSLPHVASQDLITHHVGCTSACVTTVQRRNLTFRFTKRDGPAEIIEESTPGPSESKDTPVNDTKAAAVQAEDPTLIPHRYWICLNIIRITLCD